MAVTKIKPIKSTLRKALDYITNPEKTDDKMLVSSFGCSPETADIEFDFTLSQSMEKGNNVAHHLIQAFEPGETTPEKAHEIGKQLADELLKGRYEYVLTTHIDKGHLHNHLIFCAADFVEHKKYISNKKTYYNVRNVSDRICAENGLSVVKPGRDKGKQYAEWLAEKTGTSWKSKLKTTIDTLISQSSDFDDLLRRMEMLGYEVKRGKYVSFRAEGGERFIRSKTLGVYYTEEMITDRIHGKARRPSVPARQEKKGINLIIDIENNIKAQQNAGFEQWAKIHNLKQVAKTVNFLTENNILQYAELKARIDDIVSANEKTRETLKGVETRIADLGLLIKNINTYKQTKPIYDEYKNAKNKENFRKEHQSKIIIHEAAANTLRALQVGGKLPNAGTLQREYDTLIEKKDELYRDYGKLKKELKQYDVMKQNIDSYLKPGRDIEKSKENEMLQ